MPIEKRQLVHRFGIISHNQRLELQDRLLKKAIETVTTKPYERTRNPNELEESFVHMFNGATKIEDKEKYESQARKHLERLKTKCGLSKQCEVADKQLDEAWVDLTILSQCKGAIQEESLDVLISSLNLAPFDRGHINGLFFLAETALYWLRTDAINSPYLRVSEIKLLKMAYLVFLRLFYHHMVGDLRGHKLFKSRLYMYLDGLPGYQEAYSPYPNAHLCLRYVIEVGKVIFLDDDLDPGEMKESSDSQPQDRSHFVQSASGSGSHKSGISAISRSVHDLTPTLWHSLDVWRCVFVTGRDINLALNALIKCGIGVAMESWVDSAAAIIVLAEAAKQNLDTLLSLMRIACGASSNKEEGEKLDRAHDHRVHHQEAGVSGHRATEADDIQDDASERQRAMKELKELQSELLKVAAERPVQTPAKVTRQSQRASQSRPETRERPRSGETGNRALAGTKVKDRESVTPTTYRNTPVEGSTGIQSWNWELAVIYTDILADLVVNGATSAIQKVALLGTHAGSSDVQYQDGRPPLSSAGLLDMLNFHVLGDSINDTGDDWSWRIRYTAVQGLVLVCSKLETNKMADGLYNIAWKFLLDANSYEQDERVLEALKVGQVSVKQTQASASSTKKAPPTRQPASSSRCGARLADGLAKRYLPPICVSTSVPSIPQRKSLPRQPPQKPQNPNRTTGRDERKLAEATNPPPIPKFRDRTDKDLMRIVEDQWRKELQEKLRLEEEAEKNKTKPEQTDTSVARVSEESNSLNTRIITSSTNHSNGVEAT